MNPSSPKAGDAVAAWLNSTQASHLEAADIFTLAQLAERINGAGRRWRAFIGRWGARPCASLSGCGRSLVPMRAAPRRGLAAI